jgi:hypothetical protein
MTCRAIAGPASTEKRTAAAPINLNFVMRPSFWSGNAKDQLRTQAVVAGACPKMIFNDANSIAGQRCPSTARNSGLTSGLLKGNWRRRWLLLWRGAIEDHRQSR